VIIIEIPHQRRPFLWEAPTRDDLICTVQRHAEGDAHVLFERMTPTEMADCAEMSAADLRAQAAAGDEYATEVLALSERYGREAVLFRGFTRPQWGPDPIDEAEACLAWLGHDLHALRVCETVDEARALLDPAAWASDPHGRDAVMAMLREWLARHDGDGDADA
jgi:hypothetical protein